MNPRQIPLVGGPMDGMCHELYGAIRPAEMGLSDEDTHEPKELHWYALRDGKGYYVRTEKRADRTGRWKKYGD